MSWGVHIQSLMDVAYLGPVLTFLTLSKRFHWDFAFSEVVLDLKAFLNIFIPFSMTVFKNNRVPFCVYFHGALKMFR